MLAVSDSIKGGIMIGLKFSPAGNSRAIGRHLFLASLCSLGACASFDAHPVSVLDTRAAVQLANQVPVSVAIHNFYSPDDAARDGLTPESYRNMIIGTYLMAADLRFNDFRRDLSRQSRGSSFGLDVGILGFAGGASIAAERTANILSAIASGLTGTRAALNRDIFFDRTLPALFAGMDSARTEMRTAIMVNLRRSATDYPLPVALGDLASYENAGSLDSAIQRVTGDATRRADEAQQNYVQEVQNYRGPSEVGVADIKGQITTHLRSLETATGGRASLIAAATALNLTPPPAATPQQIRFMIEDQLDTVTTTAAARDFASKVGAPGGQ